MKKKDIFFFLCFMIISLSVMFSIYLLPSSSRSGSYIEIIRDGVIITKLPLSENTVYTPSDNAFCVKVEDGYAFIAYSNCHDKCCVSFGKTNTPLKTIVCVPNRLIVKVVYPSSIDIDADAIAG